MNDVLGWFWPVRWWMIWEMKDWFSFAPCLHTLAQDLLHPCSFPASFTSQYLFFSRIPDMASNKKRVSQYVAVAFLVCLVVSKASAVFSHWEISFSSTCHLFPFATLCLTLRLPSNLQTVSNIHLLLRIAYSTFRCVHESILPGWDANWISRKLNLLIPTLSSKQLGILDIHLFRKRAYYECQNCEKERSDNASLRGE